MNIDDAIEALKDFLHDPLDEVRERADGGAAFLSLSLGPVQGFIAAARSLRDLWTGSLLLSWLTFKAMVPVLERLGPTALVFPALRGNVLVDQWLRQNKGITAVPEPDGDRRPVVGLPNRFLALVPWGDDGAAARDLGRACEAAARAAWRDLAGAVRDDLDRSFAAADPDWAARWDEQVATLPEIAWVAVPAAGLTGEEITRLGATAYTAAAPIRDLLNAIPQTARPHYDQQHAGLWAGQVEAVGRIADAARLVRPVPVLPDHDGGHHPQKCSILGSFDQMGPAGVADSAAFWKTVAAATRLDGVRLRAGERLSAISLVKRFALPARLGKELGVTRALARFPDTATVAAACWLKTAGIDPGDYRDWSGQWLHQDGDDEDEAPKELKSRLHAVKIKPPPSYYAILMADGDRMGDWLAGRKAPTLGEVLHPELRAYYQQLGDGKTVEAALTCPRPVGPALHAAISGALEIFASTTVPGIIDTHGGTLVYAGGDDVLALLPLDTALSCARALAKGFAGPGGLGPKASLSAGLAIVHHREDLRDALDAARAAEKQAKHNGRNQLGLTLRRRSGEAASLCLSWSLVPEMDALRQRFVAGMTDRWAYQLRAEAPTLDGLPPAAAASELKRLLARRGEDGKVGADDVKTLTELFTTYTGWAQTARPAEAFAILAQSASFLARGRDR